MRSEPDYLAAAAAGVAAGLAAAYAMEIWQAGAGALIATQKGEDSDDGDSSTVKLADAVSKAVRGRPVSEDGKADAGRRVHYLTGAALGAGYAMAAERWDAATLGFGGAFGVLAAAVLDESLVPVLGLGSPPHKTAPATHAYSLTAHAIFGVALEGARRLLRGRRD